MPKKNIYKGKTDKKNIIIFNGFSDCVNAFIKSMNVRKYSKQTQKHHLRHLEYLFSFLADNNIQSPCEVDLKILEQYRLNLLARNLSLHTVEFYIRSVKLFFRYLEESGVLFVNPAEKLPNPNPRKKLPSAPAASDVKKLLSQPKTNNPDGIRDRAMIEVNYACGLRASEIMSLTIFSPDIKNKVLYVQGKGNKQRTVPLGKHAVYWLEKYLRHGRPKLTPENDPDIKALWLSRQRKPMSAATYRDNLGIYCKAAGIKRISSHALRRACATHMLNNGAHPVYIQNLLGHSDLGTLSQYLMVTVTDLMKSHQASKVGK
jgi:integrase/recombinase XerD